MCNPTTGSQVFFPSLRACLAPNAVVPSGRPLWPSLTVIPAVIGPAPSRIKPPLYLSLYRTPQQFP